MKNLLFGLIATFLFSLTGNAQTANSDTERKESAYMSVKVGDELIKYKFNSIKDLEENTDKILDEVSSNNATGRPEPCQVTVEISITVTVGITSTTLSATITTSCETMAANVKKIRSQLIAIASSGN